MFYTEEELDKKLSKAGRRFARAIKAYINEEHPFSSEKTLYAHVNLATNAMMLPMYDRLFSADFDDPETRQRFEGYLQVVLTHVSQHAEAVYASYQADFNDRKHRRPH